MLQHRSRCGKRLAYPAGDLFDLLRKGASVDTEDSVLRSQQGGGSGSEGRLVTRVRRQGQGHGERAGPQIEGMPEHGRAVEAA